MSNRTYGLIVGITVRDYTHGASPFQVDVYSPKAVLGHRHRRFHLEQVCDNRDLILVSTLRQAMVDGLPVMVGSDKNGVIHDVEVVTRSSYLQADPGHAGSISGTPKIVSVASMGMGDELHWEGAKALVKVSDAEKPNVQTPLLLDLQSPDREVKLTQFKMLKQAQSAGAQVHISYETIGSPDGPEHWIREVALGEHEDIR